MGRGRGRTLLLHDRPLLVLTQIPSYPLGFSSPGGLFIPLNTPKVPWRTHPSWHISALWSGGRGVGDRQVIGGVPRILWGQAQSQDWNERAHKIGQVLTSGHGLDGHVLTLRVWAHGHMCVSLYMDALVCMHRCTCLSMYVHRNGTQHLIRNETQGSPPAWVSLPLFIAPRSKWGTQNTKSTPWGQCQQMALLLRNSNQVL